MSVSVRPLGLWGGIADHARHSRSDVDVWERLSELLDPTTFRPQLASDIEIREFPLRWGNDYVMIANPRDLLHYRLSPRDLPVLRRMDGTRTVKELVVDELDESGDLDLDAVTDLVRLLYEGNFLVQRYEDVDGIVRRAVSGISERRAKARRFARSLTIEWNDADRLIQWMYRRALRVFFNRWVALSCVLLSVIGFLAFLELAASGRFSLAGHSLAIGFLVLLVLDYFMVFAHETGHALVIAHNGRHIKSAGFQIYFGSPAFFVDSSDGMMMDRHRQMLESFAGPFAQLVVAAVSSIVAWSFPGWILSETLYRYAVLNYLVVTMNLIPLLELDGYYILADLIQVPDLRQRSLSFMRNDLLQKLVSRSGFTKQEVGLGLYGVLGVAFTLFSFYTAYFYWQTVFGGLVIRLWDGGTVTRALLVVLALFVAGPVIRGGINLVRSLGRWVRAVWRRIRFRLETAWRVEAAEMIDGLALFDDVPVETLNELAGRVRLRVLGAGQPIFRQGDQPDAFYVVRRGVLQILEEDPATGEERAIRTLGAGASFGELALVNGSPRTATVRAVEEAQLFEVDKGSFERLLADMVHVPEFAPSLQEAAELRATRCFANLSTEQIAELLERGSWMALAPGTVIVRQGEVGDAFYAISRGQFEVVQSGRPVATLGPGDFFGEIALLLDVARTADVVARTPARVFRIDREGFDRLVASAFRRGAADRTVVADQTLTH